MPRFRKGQGTTFRSGTSRSGGALYAEYEGMESAREAAKRLHVRSWRKLEAAAEAYEFYSDDDLETEYHHHNIQGTVEEIPYMYPEDWDKAVTFLDHVHKREWHGKPYTWD